MQRSSNYNFYLPETSSYPPDTADIDQITENFKKLDVITKTPSAIQTNGVANAYQISLPLKELNNDVKFIFIPLYNNTGASTLEVLGHEGISMGIKKIVNATGEQISSANLIKAKKLYLLTYDATADGGNGAFKIDDIFVVEETIIETWCEIVNIPASTIVHINKLHPIITLLNKKSNIKRIGWSLPPNCQFFLAINGAANWNGGVSPVYFTENKKILTDVNIHFNIVLTEWNYFTSSIINVGTTEYNNVPIMYFVEYSINDDVPGTDYPIVGA